MVQLSRLVWPEALGDVGAYAGDAPLSSVSSDCSLFTVTDPFSLSPADFPAHYQFWAVD